MSTNIKIAKAIGSFGGLNKYVIFYGLVRGKGPWDYKQINRAYENFGNFNYGATGHAMGIPTQVLLRAAGAAQQRANTSNSNFGSPLGGAPYGDDPADQEQIVAGIMYAMECN